MSMNFTQLRQKRVEFFEEYGFVPEVDDLDIEEDSEMWEAREELSNLKYENYGGLLYP